MKHEKILRNPSICAGDKKPRLLPMDELRWRPCEVDGVPALFHRWIEEDRLIFHVDVLSTAYQQRKIVDAFKLSGVVLPGSHTEVIRETFALVEFLDGLVAKVKPELVRFVDGEVKNEG